MLINSYTIVVQAHLHTHVMRVERWVFLSYCLFMYMYRCVLLYVCLCISKIFLRLFLVLIKTRPWRIQINLYVIYRAGNYRSYRDLRVRRIVPEGIIYCTDGSSSLYITLGSFVKKRLSCPIVGCFVTRAPTFLFICMHVYEV